MAEPSILVQVEGGIARVVLNRPDVLNALNGDMIAALRDALRGLATRADVRVLLLTGSGRGFCAGIDLRDEAMNLDAPAEERGKRLVAAFDSGVNALMRDLADFARPKITVVNGPAVGGGAGLALAADIVVAADSAYFAMPFTRQLGLVPDMGASWHLARTLGRARAIGLALLGDRLPAATAAEWGLIWRCVPDDALHAEASAIAARIAAAPPRAAAALTGCIDAAMHNEFSAQLDMERDLQSALVRTDDFVEAVTAFREKRRPVFGAQADGAGAAT